MITENMDILRSKLQMANFHSHFRFHQQIQGSNGIHGSMDPWAVLSWGWPSSCRRIDPSPSPDPGTESERRSPGLHRWNTSWNPQGGVLSKQMEVIETYIYNIYIYYIWFCPTNGKGDNYGHLWSKSRPISLRYGWNRNFMTPQRVTKAYVWQRKEIIARFISIYHTFRIT